MRYKLTILFSLCVLFLSAASGYSYHTSGIIIWPIPFNPGYGIIQINDFSGIEFNKVKMKIYNIDGDEVYSGAYPGYPAFWNGRNHSGERVEPGMYTVQIQADNIFTGLHGSKTINIAVNGGSRGTFTRGGWVGSKYIAMGKTGEVLADDVYSIYWNPAGLTGLRYTQLSTSKEIKEKAEKGKVEEIRESDLIKFSEGEKSFSVQIGLSGSRLMYGGTNGFLGMAINLPTGVLGVGVYTIYSGGIDRRDYNAYKTGNLIYSGTAFFLSYGVSLGISSFGFSVKGLYEKIGNSSYLGCGVDVGTQVYVLPFLKVGLMLQDLGTGMYPLEKRLGTRQKYNFSYPTLRLGIAIITNRNFTLAVSGTKKIDQKTFGYGVGAQYDILKWVTVHIGVNNLVFSGGVTVHVIPVDISYAFTMDFIKKGFNHTVSASVLF